MSLDPTFEELMFFLMCLWTLLLKSYCFFSDFFYVSLDATFEELLSKGSPEGGVGPKKQVEANNGIANAQLTT